MNIKTLRSTMKWLDQKEGMENACLTKKTMKAAVGVENRGGDPSSAGYMVSTVHSVKGD